MSHDPARTVPALAFTGLLLAFTLCIAAAVAAEQPDAGSGAAALRARHDELAPRLARSAFGKPLYLASSEGGKQLKGDVYAVVDAPFAKVQAAFAEAKNWCDVLILPFNVKHCAAAGGEAGSALAVRIGRRADQAAEDAYKIDFHHQVAARSANYMRVVLRADSGPVGTRDYQIALEAVPLDAARSFIHLSYSYGFGGMSKFAMQTYLATSGADKIGFTMTKDEQGKPAHVGGMLGAVERNTMRYYLAIEAYLASLSAPADARVAKRLNDWFAATERYPKQLHEMSREQYIAMKQKDTSRLGAAL